MALIIGPPVSKGKDLTHISYDEGERCDEGESPTWVLDGGAVAG
jgi:hypothetical protein